MRASDAAVSAVSELEKNADAISRMMITAAVMVNDKTVMLSPY
jgi:hypothetical protein